VILPESDGQNAERLLRQLSNHLALPIASVGLELPRQLLREVPKRRPVAAAAAFSELTQAIEPQAPMLVSRLEFLFLPELRLDPLKLLSDSARARAVVACWPGTWTDQKLRYATPSHPEFREYHNPDCSVIEAGPVSAKDPA
jgi:hypothetical protein